jgi:hypothetical protein
VQCRPISLLPSCVWTPIFSKSLIAFFLLTGLVFAAPTITVVSPKTGSTGGSPVYYEAYAHSSCANGISAMRIYSAPGVAAYTTSGSHIETFIALSAGSYSTVINAWDNCGSVATTTINITVSSTAGVTVFLPSASSASVPMHVTASAQNSSCAAGIASMRIYTASGVSPYTIDSNQLDAFITLAAGSYDLVAQAWDNCGNVFKSSFTETATTTPDQYLYGVDPNYIYEFPLTNGKVGKLAQVTNPANPELLDLLADVGGDFVYVSGTSSTGSIYAYQIDRQTGNLFPAPGSPFNIPIGSMALDPNGQFLYLASETANKTFTLSSYRIDRSDGALSLSSSTTLPAGSSIVTNYTGAYLYATYLSGSTEEIAAYSVNTTDGAFTPVAGSPYAIPGTAGQNFAGPASTGKYLYQPQAYDNEQQQLWAYEIGSDGALTVVPGSPFPEGSNTNELGPVVADWLTRYIWTTESTSQTDDVIYTSTIDASSGTVGAATSVSTGSFDYPYVTEDHSGEYLYGGGSQLTTQCLAYGGPFCPDAVSSWKVGSALTEKSEVPLTYSSGPGIIAVATSR